MGCLSVALALALASRADTLPVQDVTAVPRSDTIEASRDAPADTVKRRPRAVEYSDAYAVRLRVHRYGSYTMLPLFAAEYALGQNLINDSRRASWMKPAHAGVALGLGGLFTINTVTGAWNLWDSRSDPAGRTRRFIHTTLMLASDAGFAWDGVLGTSARSVDAQNHHRNVAIGSMALSTVGTLMMWLWKD